LNPDQKIERVRFFHWNRSQSRKPARWGSKGEATQESELSHQSALGNRTNGSAGRKLKLGQWATG
jgi:hypothetical protein